MDYILGQWDGRENCVGSQQFIVERAMLWQKWVKGQSVVGFQVTPDTTDINIMLTFSFIKYDSLHLSIDSGVCSVHGCNSSGTLATFLVHCNG
jgi:hypothetical protein